MFVTKNIYQLSGTISCGPRGANAFLLLDKKLTLVDTGLKGRAAHILGEIKKIGYSPSDIANIILTHHHTDHVGSLADLKQATGARVIAHPGDAPYIEGRLPQPGPSRPKWLAKALSPFHRLWASDPAGVDTLVNDGEMLPILGGVRIIHTPGHTPGSICLLIPQERLIIVGDLLRNTLGLKPPVGLFTVDMAQEISSIRKLTDLDFDAICFGHGRPLRHEANQAVSHLIRRLR